MSILFDVTSNIFYWTGKYARCEYFVHFRQMEPKSGEDAMAEISESEFSEKVAINRLVNVYNKQK